MFSLTPGDAGPERADAANVEPDARRRPARRGVQRVDDLFVDERVHLRDDLGRLARFGAAPLAVDQPQEPPAKLGRRHHELLQPRRIRVAGQRAEERGRVLGDRLGRGHQAEVGVEPGGPLVVVAGAEVHVAAQSLRAAPDDQADLRVGLVAAHAVDDVGARLLERARPVDVALFVEPGRELDEHGHLLVALGGALQARDDRGAARSCDTASA